MAEYIERNKLREDFELCNKQNPRWTPQRVASLIERAKTSDVVEVVRCGQCEYGERCSIREAGGFDENGHCCRGVRCLDAERGGKMTLEEIDLSVRTYHTLRRAGVNTIEQLRQLSEDDLSRIRGLGVRGIEEIRNKLVEFHLFNRVEDEPVKTNGDRIRAMSDEELANQIECPYDNVPELCYHSTCYDCVLKWLKQPVEESNYKT